VASLIITDYLYLCSPGARIFSKRGNKIKHYFSDLLFPAIGGNNFFMLLSFLGLLPGAPGNLYGSDPLDVYPGEV